MENLYIIYGRNLSKERMHRCCPTAKPMAVATLHDHQLVFQDSAHGVHANVIPMKGQEVPVVIWEMPDEDARCMVVDQWVECDGFEKKHMDIEVDGKTLQAMICVKDPGNYGIPTDRYLQHMAEGYNDFGLPIGILNKAIIHAYENTVMNGAAANTHEASILGPAR